MPSADSLLVVIVVCAAGYLLFRAMQPKPQGTIVAGKQGLKNCSGIAASREREIRTFFESDCPLETKVTIHLDRDPQRRLHIRIRGRIAEGRKQQIRNFLTHLL